MPKCYARDIKEFSYFKLTGRIELREKIGFSEPVKFVALNHEGVLKFRMLKICGEKNEIAVDGLLLEVIAVGPFWAESGDLIYRNSRFWIFLEDDAEIFDFEG